VRSADERCASVIERCEEGAYLIISGEIDTKNATTPPLDTEIKRRQLHISHHELTEDAEDATLLDVSMVMGGGFRDARMLHVLYGPRTTTMLCERVD
jgi:hypothetical protein